MMTKPSPSSAGSGVTSTTASEVKKKSSPEDMVKDLEKRLQLLETPKPAPPAVANVTTSSAAAPAAKAAGKNPLLARIMAAQERAKQVGPVTSSATPAVTDLLDSFDAPTESAVAPPPPFDISLLPPPLPEQDAPPPFDDSLLLSTHPNPIVQQSTDSRSNLSYPIMSSTVASAPVFEDLLDDEQQQQHMPPPLQPPPSSSNNQELIDQDAIDAILGLEGLSPEEKAALIKEQEKIMASIQKEHSKKGSVNSAQARADAFEQRSHAAAVQAIGNNSRATVDLGDGTTVPLHGQAKTHQAIQDGTAVIVQCLACDSWMQVTSSATMMFCPNCQTVSPVVTADEKAFASQLAADQELAEQLQKEEYKKAEKVTAQRRAKEAANSPKTATQQPSAESSWMDWLGFGASATTPPTTATRISPEHSFAQKPLQRGEIGMSLPPGASRNNTALAMAPAYTGEEDDVMGSETIRFAPSRESDFGDEEGGAARVAKAQPLFNCVADSISSAATSLYHTVAADTEGNVHGVDTSGLLAVTQAGRGDYQNMDSKNSNR